MHLRKEEYGWILYLNKKESAFVSFINEWKQIFGKMNWYSITFVNIYFENDMMAPGYEFEFEVLGLGFCMRINRSWEGTELQKRIDTITNKENVSK